MLGLPSRAAVMLPRTFCSLSLCKLLVWFFPPFLFLPPVLLLFPSPLASASVTMQRALFFLYWYISSEKKNATRCFVSIRDFSKPFRLLWFAGYLFRLHLASDWFETINISEIIFGAPSSTNPSKRSSKSSSQRPRKHKKAAPRTRCYAINYHRL